jgi:hypothetical protein
LPLSAWTNGLEIAAVKADVAVGVVGHMMMVLGAMCSTSRVLVLQVQELSVHENSIKY